ncbi:MAG: hypothetical protein FWF82_07230 [Oscillospiraceae bacterium]|nr:hypothetical protein [Oscillospiraceae bacterium]
MKNEVFETSRSTETNLIEYKAVGEISRCKSCFIVLFKEDNYRIPLFSFINRFGFVRANVIPLSAFESEEQADAFFDMLKGKTVQSSGGLL